METNANVDTKNAEEPQMVEVVEDNVHVVPPIDDSKSVPPIDDSNSTPPVDDSNSTPPVDDSQMKEDASDEMPPISENNPPIKRGSAALPDNGSYANGFALTKYDPTTSSSSSKSRPQISALLLASLLDLEALENHLEPRISRELHRRRLHAKAVIAEFYATGQAQEAIRVLKVSLDESTDDYLPRVDPRATRKKLRRLVGRLDLFPKDIKKGLQNVEAELQILRNSKDRCGEAMLCLAMGEWAASLSARDQEQVGENIKRPQQWSSAALEIFEELEDPLFAGIASLEAGIAGLGEGDSDMTAKWACNAFRHFDKIDDRCGFLHAYNLLAHSYLIRQNYAQALEKATRGLDIAQMLNSQEFIDMQTAQCDYIKECDDIINVPPRGRSYEGVWERGAGDEVCAIIGKTIMWMSGETRSYIMPLGSSQYSYNSRGTTVFGEMRKFKNQAPQMIWDNGDKWVMVHRRAGVPCSPPSFRIPVNKRMKDPVGKLIRSLRQVGVTLDTTALTPFLDIQISQVGANSTQLLLARHLMNKYFSEELPVQIFMDLATIGDIAAFLTGYMNAVGKRSDSEDEDEE